MFLKFCEGGPNYDKTLAWHGFSADPESFVRGGPPLTTFFLLLLLLVVLADEKREDPNTTISGRTKRWRADDSPTLNAGLKAL